MNTASQKALRIGLTGGIASGKSAVADMFAELGVTVIDTDDLAREVVAPGQPALAEIVDRFGAELLRPDGSLDRRQLRNLVFADEGKRRHLEAILHPLIQALALERIEQATGPYLVLVVPLLLESGFDKLVDRVLVVDCDEQQQHSRLIARDTETPASSAKIMAAQTGRKERLAAADDIIDNSGSLEDTRLQVSELHDKYQQFTAQNHP